MSESVSPAAGLKKMKQARLPFAPIQKKSELSDDISRKRKLSDPSNTQQNKDKITKTEEAEGPYEEVGAEYVKETESVPKKRKNPKVDKEQKENEELKSGKAKEEVEVIDIDDDSQPGRPDANSEKIKMSFKPSKKQKTVSEDQDDDIDLEVASKSSTEQKGEKEKTAKPKKEKGAKKAAQKKEANKEKEVGEEEVSMTEDWAEFHEKELEKNPVDGPGKEIVRLCTPKDKKTPPAADDETPKDTEKTDASSTTVEAKTAQSPAALKTTSAKKPKANPLAKFLVKMKPGTGQGKLQPKKLDNDVDDPDEIEIIEDKTPKSEDKEEETETPQPEPSEEQTQTGDKSDDAGKQTETSEVKEKSVPESKPEISTEQKDDVVVVSTPVLKKTASVSGTPGTGTPASVRAKQLAVTKLRVKIHEITMEMEEVVKQENYLKAHELKQKISSLEAEIKTIQASESFVSFSPAATGIVKEVFQISTADAGTPTASTKPKLETAAGGSLSSSPATPASSKATKIKKVTTPGSTSDGSPALPRNLTPKQLALQEERRKKAQKAKEELDKKKAEKLAQLALAKQDREREKEIEKRKKDIERLEKEQIKREKDREREKEKKEKEEERLKKKAEKEAELKKKDEERKKEEEAEAEKKKRAAMAFKGFFVKKDVPKEKNVENEAAEEEVVVGSTFNPFQVKNNMRLAPLVRNDTVKAMRSIDSLDGPVGPNSLYLEQLRAGAHTPAHQGKTWPWEKNLANEDNDVEVVEEEEEEDEEDLENQDVGVMILRACVGKPPRAKLLQFHANQRPAYWGTWTKKSGAVKGRRPFGLDKELFDYEYDSDEDWEDEGEGESLSDADDEKEEEDDYEVDNEFFVPHGYLSDEEEGKDEDEVFNPEREKEKLKLKEKEFQAECNKKTQLLKPRLWGCYFESEELDTGVAATQLFKILSGYAAIPCCNNNLPIPTAFSNPSSTNSPTFGEEGGSESAKVKVKSKAAKSFPEEALPDLVRLVHVNSNNKVFLAREFIQFWSTKQGGDPVNVGEEGQTPGGGTPSGPLISKRKVVDKIQEVANYKGLEGRTGRFWVVKPEILKQFGMSAVDSTTSNTWTYILEQPNSRTPATSTTIIQEDGPGSRPNSPLQSKANAPNPASLITKFTKVLTEEERAKLNATPPSAKRAKLNLKPSPIQTKKLGMAGNPIINQIAVKKSPNPIGFKKTTTTPIAVKKTVTPNAAKKTTATPIAVKKGPAGAGSPGSISVRNFASMAAKPIQIRKAPKAAGTASPLMAQLSTLPGLTITKAAKPEEECITLD